MKALAALRIAAFVAAPLLLYAPAALAWGGLAHEAICEIAFLELNDTARQRVIALIRQDREFRTFRASCNWPDRPRQRASEHFVNLPRDATGLGDDPCPLAEKCVVTAIEEDFAVLASPDATDTEKLEALKFLGHWVGDIHQPLHAWFEDDRGGNRIRTTAAPATISMRSGTGACRGAARHATRSLSRANSAPASPTSNAPSGWPAIRWTGPMNWSRSHASPPSGIASWSVTPASTKPTTASLTMASPRRRSW